MLTLSYFQVAIPLCSYRGVVISILLCIPLPPFLVCHVQNYCCFLARHFFCFTLQVIVILELCSNQPHEACGVDLWRRKNFCH
jgi:hypothetical protein